MTDKVIDRAASKAAMMKEWRIKRWALSHGFSDDTVKAYFYERRCKEGSAMAAQIAAALKKDGFARYLPRRRGRTPNGARTVRSNSTGTCDGCQQ